MSVPSQQPASDPADQPGAAGSAGQLGDDASAGQWFAPLCGPADGDSGTRSGPPDSPDPPAEPPTAEPAEPADSPDSPDLAGQAGQAGLGRRRGSSGRPGLSSPGLGGLRDPGATAAPAAGASIGPSPGGPFPACPSSPAGGPSSAGEALGMVLAGLGWLAHADAASVPAAVQAECLRGLERAQSVYTAARGRVLAAFTAQGGYEDDGQGSPRTWLTWQTRVTRPAASAALASMRSLGEHPGIAGALAGGLISVSWARQIADWTGLLPGDCRGDADVILLAAAAGGADLAGLAELAEEIRRRTARPDRDDDGGFDDRALRLATTLGGAGRLHADLTPGAAAALQAVLDSLGKKAGPEDTRTAAQRRHDALEEGCLAAAGRRHAARPRRAARPAPALPHPGRLPQRRRRPRRGQRARPGAARPGRRTRRRLRRRPGPRRHRPRRPRPRWTASPPCSPGHPGRGPTTTRPAASTSPRTGHPAPAPNSAGPRPAS